MAAASSSHSVAPRRKVSRHRGEGQWAAGHLTPLNGNEQLKKDDDGLNVRTRIETIYSKRGFHSIDPTTCAGASVGGASTPSAAPGSTAAAPVCWSPRSSRTSTS